VNRTPIEWVKNPDGTQGYTWNPITGCLNGCEYCYARKLANGRLKSRYLANTNISPLQTESPGYYASKLIDSLDPFYPRFWQNRIPDDKFHYFGKLKQVKPRGIFVCDMGELFGDWIPPEWQEQIFRVITLNPWHRFYLLTKQPQNLIKFSPFPPNCWVGVTATNAKMLREALMYLEEIRASVKYVSLEPLLGQIYDPLYFLNALPDFLSVIDWVIIGAQTKPYKPPKIEWVEEIVQACDKAGVKVFLKDNLKPLFRQVVLENTHCLTYPYGELRQEVPK